MSLYRELRARLWYALDCPPTMRSGIRHALRARRIRRLKREGQR